MHLLFLDKILRESSLPFWAMNALVLYNLLASASRLLRLALMSFRYTPQNVVSVKSVRLAKLNYAKKFAPHKGKG